MKTSYFIVLIPLFLALQVQAQTTTVPEASVKEKTVTATKVKVFPNPAANVVNVLGLKNTSKANISISDIYGNVVLTHRWEIRRNAVSIPISTLDPGTYIVTVRSENQRVRTKFIKQ